MLKIRLTRMGKKHQPTYRIVVAAKEKPVRGDYLDLLGTYNPLKGDVQIDKEKALEWLNKGAQPSERLARLLTSAGVKHPSVVVKMYTPKPKEEVAKETPNSKNQNPKDEESSAEPVAEAEETAEATTDEAVTAEESAEEPAAETPETPAE
jgi:small subunit ribosomal protein S16